MPSPFPPLCPIDFSVQQRPHGPDLIKAATRLRDEMASPSSPSPIFFRGTSSHFGQVAHFVVECDPVWQIFHSFLQLVSLHLYLLCSSFACLHFGFLQNPVNPELALISSKFSFDQLESLAPMATNLEIFFPSPYLDSRPICLRWLSR